MCDQELVGEYIRYVFLFVCANGINQSVSKKQEKTYHVTVPGNFCQPCPGVFHVFPNNESCHQRKSEIADTVKELRRYYTKSENLISNYLRQMLESHATLPDDHPINITDFESDSKIKRMIRHKSLNEKELAVHLAYSRVSILASYLQLASDMNDDIPHNKSAQSFKEKLKGPIDNLSRASCRHFSLAESLSLKRLSKRVCNFKKRVTIGDTTHRIQYVVSVLKYGKKHMRHLIEDLSNFQRTLENCEILPIADRDLSMKSSSEAKKEPRSMTKSKRMKNKRRRHRNRCRNQKKNRRNKKKNSKKCRKNRRNRNKSRKSRQ